MKSQITCRGRVRSVSSGHADVEVSSCAADACAGCGGAFVCSAHSSPGVMTAAIPGGLVVRQGDEVSLESCDHWRWSAIALCFVVPCLIMIVACVAAIVALGSDAVAAAAAIVAPCVYFAVLYWLRRCGGLMAFERRVWKIRSVNGDK